MGKNELFFKYKPVSQTSNVCTQVRELFLFHPYEKLEDLIALFHPLEQLTLQVFSSKVQFEAFYGKFEASSF